MKTNAVRTRTVVLTLLFAFLFALLSGAPFARAENADTHLSDLSRGSGEDKQHVGVRFYNTYFGYSDIALEIELYSALSYKDDPAIVALFSEIDAFTAKIDALATTHAGEAANEAAERSDVYRFNALPFGGRTEVARETAEMVRLAREMYVRTDGAYDPSCYRLVDLWGFSSRVSYGNMPYDRVWTGERVTDSGVTYTRYYLPLPRQDYVDAFKALCDFSAVELTEEDGRYYLTKNCPDVTVDGEVFSQWIDLGGVAKGYVCDGVADILQKHGFSHYYVNCGGSSKTYTDFENGDAIGFLLENPDKLYTGYAALKLSFANMSTSGQYIRNYTVNGVRYCHIIDPKTGRPVETGIETVTVVGGDSAAEADCWTTALTVLGKDNLVSFINGDYCREKGIKVCGVYTGGGGNQIVTNLPQTDFETIDENFAYAMTSYQKEGKTLYEYDGGAKSYASKKTVTVIVLLSVFGAALIGYTVYKVVKNRGVSRAETVAQVKKDKFFKKADLFVYAGIFVLLAALFAAFVFGRTARAAESIEIQTFAGQKLFAFDVSSANYTVYDNSRYAVAVEKTEKDGVFTFTVTVTEEDGGFNVLTIVKNGNSVSAKMTDADCGLNKECVNYFPAVTDSGGVIVCNPHGLKVVAGEESEYILA